MATWLQLRTRRSGPGESDPAPPHPNGRYVEEMARVLKPGGRIVIATWCQREEGERPFTRKERKTLDYLYGEWTHPYFISIEEYRP